jgi:nicotinamidase-related amidase
MLIIDMVSCWDFEDGERLLPRASAIALSIARLKSRARREGVPIIYANDNAGRWRSDFRSLIGKSVDQGGKGREITEYTFWSYLRNRWPRDAGMRIDHLLVNEALLPHLKSAGVDKAMRVLIATEN